MKQAVNCAVKADRAIRCPICQRGRLLNAAEHTDLRSLRLFRPDHLLIVDAVDAGCEPGSIVDIPCTEIGGPSFSSHMLPLKVMVDYLIHETGTDVTMLGLQYRGIEFGAELSPEMQEAVEELTQALLETIPALLTASHE